MGEGESRSELWWWVLFLTLALIAALILDSIIGTAGILYLLALLGLFLPGLAVSVRRLHDIDKSGWRILISFVPLIGGIIVLIWYVRRGDDGENRFGADPLQV